ncbi:hypothetical protein V3595_00565 [Bacillus sp. CFBP9009]
MPGYVTIVMVAVWRQKGIGSPNSEVKVETKVLRLKSAETFY